MARELIDTIPDLYGDEVEVSVIDGLVTLELQPDVCSVVLDRDGQERFARAYVTACRQAEASAPRPAPLLGGGKAGG